MRSRARERHGEKKLPFTEENLADKVANGGRREALGSSALPETPTPISPLGTPCWVLLLALVGAILTLELWASAIQMTHPGISCGQLRQSWNVEHY